MSSRFQSNGAARRMPLWGSEPLKAEDPALPLLRDALGRQISDATTTLFSERGPYPINTHIVRPAVIVEPAKVSEEYFTGIKLRVLWDGNPRSHRETDPREGLKAYLGDLKTIFDRNQGRTIQAPRSLLIECTPGALHSVYRSIVEQKCPKLRPMHEHMTKIETIIERMVSGPRTLS